MGFQWVSCGFLWAVDGFLWNSYGVPGQTNNARLQVLRCWSVLSAVVPVVLSCLLFYVLPTGFLPLTGWGVHPGLDSMPVHALAAS